MINTNVDVYANFLVQCWQVMGPFDIEKLANDDAYKTAFFNRVALNADDTLFEMANIVNHQLIEEEENTH